MVLSAAFVFANLNIHEQKAKPKKNGMKILDSQGVITQLDGIMFQEKTVQ